MLRMKGTWGSGQGTGTGTLEGSEGAKDGPLQEPQRRPGLEEAKGACGVAPAQGPQVAGPLGHWTPKATRGPMRGCGSRSYGSSQTNGGSKACSFQAQPKLRVTRSQSGKRPSGKQGQHHP